LYEKHSASYGVCRSLGWIGHKETLPEFFDALAIHNQSAGTGDSALA
jgi:hypothetical protein